MWIAIIANAVALLVGSIAVYFGETYTMVEYVTLAIVLVIFIKQYLSD